MKRNDFMAIEEANCRRMNLTIPLEKAPEVGGTATIGGQNWFVKDCTNLGSGIYQLELIQFLENTQWTPKAPRPRRQLKASELVAELQSLIRLHGDLDVAGEDGDFGKPISQVGAMVDGETKKALKFIVS
jgi:hypothetical protein